MDAQPTALVRARRIELSPTAFRRVALAVVGMLWLIVATGATVRLTASGLGCRHWPGCTAGNPFPEKDYHAFIEFGNRVVAATTIAVTLLGWLAARRTAGLAGWVGWLALATFVGTLAQAPLGAITVYADLNPYLVMSHLFLSLVVLGAGVLVAVEAMCHERGRVIGAVPGWVGRAGLVLAAACLALVVSGAFVTAGGPHPGGADVRRLGTFSSAIYVHVRATAVFGCALLVVLGALAARRDRARGLFAVAVGLLVLVLVQMTVGETQYRTELPWWLVLVHVSLAAAVWAATAALAALLLRTPAPLAGHGHSGHGQ